MRVASLPNAQQRLSLRFVDNGLENAYQRAAGKESLDGFRVIAAASTILWAIAAFLLPVATDLPAQVAAPVSLAMSLISLGVLVSSRSAPTLDRQHALASLLTAGNGVVILTLASIGGVAGRSSRMLRRVVARLPVPLQVALFKGGQRSDRLRDPDAVVAALRVRARDRVADVGPGYGHFTLRLALAVEPDGICYAADADARTLEDLRRAADERAITNLRTVLTSPDRLELPEAVDLLFFSATYHHVRDPERYFAAARSLLRPGGRVAVLESRLEGVAARWMNPHGSVPSRVCAEMTRAGYELAETHDIVHGHWFATFQVRRGKGVPHQ